MTNEIGFLKEARRRSVAPIILFVADTDRVSRRAYQMLRGADSAKRWSRSTTNMWCAANCPRHGLGGCCDYGLPSF
jgi:hypothetical protein